MCKVVDICCSVVWAIASVDHWSCRADCLFSALFCGQGRCFWTKSGFFKCLLSYTVHI